MHFNLAVAGNRYVRDLGDKASEGFMYGQTASVPLRHRPAPSGFICNQFEDPFMTGMIRQ